MLVEMRAAGRPLQTGRKGLKTQRNTFQTRACDWQIIPTAETANNLYIADRNSWFTVNSVDVLERLLRELVDEINPVLQDGPYQLNFELPRFETTYILLSVEAPNLT